MNPLLLRLSFLAACILLHAGCTHTPELHQIGLVWLKHPGSREEQQKIIQAVHAMGRKIPEVKCAYAGRTDGVKGPFSDTSYDVCFILTFQDEPARQRYNAHPAHQKAAREVFLPLSQKLLFYRFTDG